MTGMVDLTVNGWCEQVYALQREIEEASPTDEVSYGDYRALAAAIKDLYVEVADRINTYIAAQTGEPKP